MKLALQPVRRNRHAKPAPPSLGRVVSVSVSKLFGLRCSDGKNVAPISPFRMNTCESVSKQRTLTTFRMNTYEKRGEGRGWFIRLSFHRPAPASTCPNPFTSSTSSISFPSNLLPPLCRLQKSQLLWNQANPASFCKTPGRGGFSLLLTSNLQLLTSVFAYRGVSRSSTASDSKCPRSIASCVPSGENRNLATCSEVKRVSVEGGEPQTVMKEAPWGWSVSPDGKTIVSTEVRELDHRLVLRLDSVEDKTTNYHDLDPRASPPLAFAPDPKAVVYLVREKGVDNVVVSGFRQTGRNEPWEPARLGGVCCGGSRFGRLTEASPV